MKIALAALGFIDNDIDYNKKVIINALEKFSNVDIIVFGKSFNVFNFMNKRITIGLCGDLWYDENIDSINELNPDIVLWPVYTDYNYDEWNKKIKYEYLEQANRINAKGLLVNSYCKNKNDIDIARGGALYISNKKIVDEVLSGKEDILIVEV